MKIARVFREIRVELRYDFFSNPPTHTEKDYRFSIAEFSHPKSRAQHQLRRQFMSVFQLNIRLVINNAALSRKTANSSMFSRMIHDAAVQ